MKNNKGLIIGIIGLIIVMIGGTYAYYKWNSTSNINISVGIEGSTVTFNGGSNVTGVLIPTSSKEEGIKKDITVIASEAGSTMSLYMDLTTMPSELTMTPAWSLCTPPSRSVCSARSTASCSTSWWRPVWAA